MEENAVYGYQISDEKPNVFFMAKRYFSTQQRLFNNFTILDGLTLYIHTQNIGP